MPASVWPSQVSAPDRKPVGLVRRAVWHALLGAGLLHAALPARAVSLGEAQTSSRIGDVLQVRIPLTTSPDDNVTADCIRLEGPRSDNSDDLPWLRTGRLRLTTQANGQQSLLVSSLQSIQSPVIMLAVRIDCNATLRREYTLLLNPPGPAEANPAVSPPASPSNTGNTWRTARGESLRSIAQGLFPSDKKLQSRYVALLRERNADKLQGLSDTTPLPVGTELGVPDTSELNTTPVVTKPAARPRAARPAAVLPTESMGNEANPPPIAPRKSRTGPPRERLIVGGEERGGLQMATGLSGRKELSEAEREKLRTELQLIASLDDKIATQLELSEKLRQLEALQVQLQSDVQGLESRIRVQQASLQGASTPVAAPPAEAAPARPVAKTSPAATTPAASLPAWQDWMLPAGGIAALLALLLIWRRRRDSGDDDTIEEIATPAPETETAPSGQPADDLFEPLSEEDIWPDAGTLKRPAGANTGTDLPGPSELGPTSVLHIEEDVEEHNSAVELAEIMMSFGRVQGAAQTLADFIRANPKQAVKPWVKLLEVYKTANMRTEFDALTSQLNKTFNVKPVTWDDFDVALRAPESLENIVHLSQKVCELWGKRECQAFLHGLLRDNRQGTRQGFPLAIVDEILLLLAILESHLGAYKHDIEPEPQPVPEPASPTMTTPGLPRTVQPVFPETLPAPTLAPDTKRAPERSALDFDIVGTSDFDHGLNTEDLTRTLHINLDDLPDSPTRTGSDPHKPDDA
jgi:pilus assembly protein FimV